ncbi:MAG: hypothetical protein IE931_10695 [Sphingobacteriales bacterium]|nr:hypothetical protein [Sphingobacteriales bacterium]
MLKIILIGGASFFLIKRFFKKTPLYINVLISLAISTAFYLTNNYIENNNSAQCDDVRNSLKCLEGTWHYVDKENVTWEAEINFDNKKKDNFDYKGFINLKYRNPNSSTFREDYKGRFDIEYQTDIYGDNYPSIIPENSDISIMIINNDALVGYQVRISAIYEEMFGDGMIKY